MNLKSRYIGILALVTALFVAACEKAPEQISLEGKTMGTTYHIKYIDDGKVSNLPSPEKIQEALDKLLVDVNDQMSTYQKDSVISQFNSSEEINKPFLISDDFAKVVKEGIKLNDVTEGALDITIGRLVNLWGFGPDKRLNREPSAEKIAEYAKSVGIHNIELTVNNGQTFLIKKEPHVYIDLSSIAKGFGVDKLSEYFEQLNVANYLVEIGGEIRGKGKNLSGTDWRISIEKPEFTQGTTSQIVVPLHNLAMATSGNYRNYFEDENGDRLSHIIDPKILRPISHNLASVTVFSDKTMTADGLATGLFVLGPEKALEIAEKEELAIFLIIKTEQGYTTEMSSKFKKLTEQQ
ncbi:FAD:protein FMN transferase [Otariodibacter oris]|uniref:FAD:protein FMN transferase n=1 Tax=Otariodibacter oris TaxID=1032623 RepID=A0A420XHF9_9PAST|nr:FAD:protein FMN transferase [Otariodibacter oris]QGM81325.1 thiamine biosynthesis protein ApbE [Otariodibacter oris]RKR72890.1 thiamine biosynthesis lipoprotein [Otariodibacter oris]